MVVHCLSKLWRTYFFKTPEHLLKKWHKSRARSMRSLEEYKRIEHVDDVDIFPRYRK